MFLIMTIKNSIPVDLILMTKDWNIAQKKFYEVCQQHIGRTLTEDENKSFIENYFLKFEDITIACLNMSNAEWRRTSSHGGFD